ncbi:MAG: GNAT family N-acetyltransferase [Mycobacteriales bacterium]|nr:GNAT family N-acetyltransferase [Frankia sp.]
MSAYSPPAVDVCEAAFAELSQHVLYEILRLRADAFIVEQRCIYPDLDGRDEEPTTRHYWAQSNDGAVVGCLRIVAEPDGSDTIGRVVTIPAWRGRGVSSLLMRRALADCRRPARIKAQSRLAPWYAGFGFAPSGAEFMDYDIPHLPMVVET